VGLQRNKKIMLIYRRQHGEAVGIQPLPQYFGGTQDIDSASNISASWCSWRFPVFLNARAVEGRLVFAPPMFTLWPDVPFILQESDWGNRHWSQR